VQISSAQPLPQRLLLIGGRWISGGSKQPILDKFTLQPCGELALPTREQVRDAVRVADDAYRENTLTPHERGAILDRVARLLAGYEERMIVALRQEAGFPRSDAQGEFQRCLQTFRLCAEEARSLTGEMIPIEGAPRQAGRIGFTLRVPLGVVCAITPFNAPLNTVAHKVGPAIAAGNAVVLKPSPHTPTTSALMAEAFLEAGLPAGLMTVLHGGPNVVDWLLEEQAIRFIAFTGSTSAGRSIQQRAGLRRTQMELGSIAFTILAEDANLDVALRKVVDAAYRKAGQVCTSVQMLLVQRPILAACEARLAVLVRALVHGDPSDERTVVGPVVSVEAAERIEQWVDTAVSRGARRVVGGDRKGAVIAPTLLTDVDDTMPTSCSEVFGPVLSIVPFDTLDEAIARVNATPYGLATGLFTNRLDHAMRAARRLEVGGVHINETSSSRVDVMPYGGSKESGFGREGPQHAVREMSEERLVTILA
jgi:succinate-semialdehyde dehydrogenase/glutarate-semialdehyde dehydrogenase